MKKSILIITVICSMITGILFANRFLKQQKQNEKQTDIQKIKFPSPTKAPLALPSLKSPGPKKIKITKIPDQINLDVPFTSQAPHVNWQMPYQEACEEAALIMIHHYLRGERAGEIDKNLANKEILDMISWQEKNWGGHYDLPAAEIAKLAREYYNYKNVKVKYNITVEDIKKELAQKNPVIVPAAGRILVNPYFTPPGPVYHNLVVVGYDTNGFIVNDPGVWQGHKFRYSYKNLIDSVHDFVKETTKANPSPILQGRRAMIVIKK